MVSFTARGIKGRERGRREEDEERGEEGEEEREEVRKEAPAPPEEAAAELPAAGSGQMFDFDDLPEPGEAGGDAAGAQRPGPDYTRLGYLYCIRL